MIRTQEQATGLVELQKGIYAKVLGWGSKRAARIKDYLQELKDIKIISAIYEPPKGSVSACARDLDISRPTARKWKPEQAEPTKKPGKLSRILNILKE